MKKSIFKKSIGFCLAIVMALGCALSLTGCGKQETAGTAETLANTVWSASSITVNGKKYTMEEASEQEGVSLEYILEFKEDSCFLYEKRDGEISDLNKCDYQLVDNSIVFEGSPFLSVVYSKSSISLTLQYGSVFSYERSNVAPTSEDELETLMTSMHSGTALPDDGASVSAEAQNNEDSDSLPSTDDSITEGAASNSQSQTNDEIISILEEAGFHLDALKPGLGGEAYLETEYIESSNSESLHVYVYYGELLGRYVTREEDSSYVQRVFDYCQSIADDKTLYRSSDSQTTIESVEDAIAISSTPSWGFNLNGYWFGVSVLGKEYHLDDSVGLRISFRIQQ